MPSNINVELRHEIEGRLRRMEQIVKNLEEEISELNDKLTEERHRLDVIKEFYYLEFEDSSILNSQDAPLRFEKGTIRSACRDLLQQKGPMHVADLHTAMTNGGRKVTKTSITSTLIRRDEFERVAGKPNTFRLRTDITSR